MDWRLGGGLGLWGVVGGCEVSRGGLEECRGGLWGCGVFWGLLGWGWGGCGFLGWGFGGFRGDWRNVVGGVEGCRVFWGLLGRGSGVLGPIGEDLGAGGGLGTVGCWRGFGGCGVLEDGGGFRFWGLQVFMVGGLGCHDGVWQPFRGCLGVPDRCGVCGGVVGLVKAWG